MRVTLVGVRQMFVFLGLTILIGACVSTKSTYLNPGLEKYDPLPPDSVRIFMDEAELDSLEYVRVALIEATGSGEFTSQTEMYDAIRKRAGKLGCNGVLMPQIKEPGAGAKVAAAIFGTDTERRGSAIAIRIIGRKSK